LGFDEKGGDFMKDLQPIETVEITQDEVDAYTEMRYRVTTVVPLSNAPKQNTYVFSQSELDEFLKGYADYEEFLIAIIRIPS
jgi:hypothetical protein